MAHVAGGERPADDSPAAATVEVVTEPDGPVIRLSGDLDISNIDTVRSQVDAVIGGRPDSTVFDLSGLEFMDSSGIALLLQVAAKVGRVVVRQPSGIVRRVLEATGVSAVLHLEP